MVPSVKTAKQGARSVLTVVYGLITQLTVPDGSMALLQQVVHFVQAQPYATCSGKQNDTQ